MNVFLQTLVFVESEIGYQTPCDVSRPADALAKGRLPSDGGATTGSKSTGVQGGMQIIVPGRREGAGAPSTDGPPDQELYVPKVDVRQGGWCAYWVWRGTRVSNQHVSRFCNVQVQVEELDEYNKVMP